MKRPRPARPRPVDCFYVYPTVSDAPGPQAPLRIDPELRSIALYQAARYSQYCRVYAPVYRQLSLQGIGGSAGGDPALAYGDVRAAWRTYLRRHNRGRGVVLVGHSQGTYMLRRLITDEIDPQPRLRRKLVSALLLGGDATVRAGRDRGGDFKYLRACRSARQLGCVVAFSIFNAPVPADSSFGRAGDGREVLCTNPASLGGGAGALDPIFPSKPFAPGVIGSLIPGGRAEPAHRLDHLDRDQQRLPCALLVHGRGERAAGDAARRRPPAHADLDRLRAAPHRREPPPGEPREADRNPGPPLGAPLLAEGVGFEPTRDLTAPSGFQGRCIQPLCHPSGGSGDSRCVPRRSG